MPRRKARPASTNREALARWGFADRLRNAGAYTAEDYARDVAAGEVDRPQVSSCPRSRFTFRGCDCAQANRHPAYYLQRVRRRSFTDAGEQILDDTRDVCLDTWLCLWWESCAAWRDAHEPDEERESLAAAVGDALYRAMLDRAAAHSERVASIVQLLDEPETRLPLYLSRLGWTQSGVILQALTAGARPAGDVDRLTWAKSLLVAA